MKVSVRQSGGWGGVRMGCTLDTHLMAPDQAHELERLAGDEGLFARHEVPPTRGRDVATYEVEVEDDQGAVRRCAAGDLDKPPALSRLLAFARPMFRPLPR